MLFCERVKFRAIKLYSIGLEQENIDRPMLVDELLRLFETNFDELPKEYVIHGSYEIRRGASVGIRAFKNKLVAKGHDKYYALDGCTENRFGFHASFNSIIGDTTYSELITWCFAADEQLSFEETIKKLTIPFSTSCGYEIEIDKGFDICSESKIKIGLFGGLKVKISYDHLNWIKGFEKGEFRPSFKNNLLSSKQLGKLLSINPKSKHSKFGKLHLVQSIL